MNQWVIYDSQKTSLEGFDPSLLPKEASRFVTAYIHSDAQGNKITSLEVGSYVGALPLLDGSTLYLAPRIGYASLARMISVAERLDDAVQKEFNEFAELGYDDTEYAASWIQLLARSFVTQLRFIEKSSLRSERSWKREQSSSVRGRVDLIKTTFNLLQNREKPVEGFSKVRVYDTVENRFLSAAAQTLLNLNLVQEADKSLLLRWANLLNRKPLKNRELETVNKNIAANYYAGSRSYYIQALVMARLILLQGSIAFDARDQVRSEALLTNMYMLYETYLRVLLRKHLTDQGYIIEKLESGTPTLFIDGTAELQPDIIISKGTKARLLIDAKYKLNESVSNADYFQMKAYMDAFGVDEGVIVRPSEALKDGVIVSRKLQSGKVIHDIKLNMNNWEKAESFFIATIQNLLT